MSTQKFCHNCGKSVQPDWKGCPHCMTSLLSLASTPAPPTTPQYAQGAATYTPPFMVRPGSEDDDDDYIDKIPHLQLKQNALQLEIAAQVQKPDTFGATILAGAASPPHPSEIYERKGLSPEDTLAQWKQEASSIRHERQSTEIRVRNDKVA